ncbi:MAG: hypothetical protein ACTSYZ_08515 [Candidatus Helarchaeota archaeon]
MFKKYKKEIEYLSLKIKEWYYELYLGGYISVFLKLYKSSDDRADLNVSELLEGINFMKYFTKEILN